MFLKVACYYVGLQRYDFIYGYTNVWGYKFIRSHTLLLVIQKLLRFPPTRLPDVHRVGNACSSLVHFLQIINGLFP